MDMRLGQLMILSNEAERQRALDAVAFNLAFTGDKQKVLSSNLRCHGPYTDGYYENEQARLLKDLGKKNG